MRGNLAPFLAVGVLMLALLGLFAPILGTGTLLAPLDISRSFYEPWVSGGEGSRPHNHNPSDAVTQYIPYRMLAAQAFEEDGYIGWNPYGMGGISLAANTMALPASPSMQLHRWMPFETAWNLGIVLEFFVAGLGMLVFLRSRRHLWVVCVAGALIYMLNTQFVIWVYHRWALASFCWMPWVLWSAVDWKGWGDWHWRRLLAPVFLALALHGASIQHMVFVFLATACLALAALPDWRRPLASWRVVAGWGLVWLLATAMTAHTLLPQVQAYLENVGVGHTRGDVGYSQGVLQPLLNLVFLFGQIWPWLGGDAQTIDAWRAFKGNFMSIAYLGTVPMVLAFLGVFRKEMPRAAKWLIILGLLIPLTPLVGPLYHRVQLLFLLGGAWMAAEMLSAFLKRPSHLLPLLFSGAVAVLAAVLALSALLPSSQREFLREKAVQTAVQRAQDTQFGSDSEWVEARASEWVDRIHIGHPRTLGLMLLLAAGSLGLFLLARPGLPGKLGVALIGAAALSELTMFFLSWRTFSDTELLTERHPHIEQVAQVVGSGRLLQADVTRDFVGTVAFLPPNQFQPYGVRILGGYESIHSQSVWRALDGEVPEEERLMLAGVSASIEARSDTQPNAGSSTWPVAAEFPKHIVRRNPAPLTPVISGPDTPPDSVNNLIPALRAAREITPESRTMSALVMSLPEKTRWVRFDENYHRGWSFRLSDEAAWMPLQRGIDGALWLHMEAPTASETQVEVRFHPVATPIRLLSGLALAATLAWIAVLAVARPRTPA